MGTDALTPNRTAGRNNGGRDPVKIFGSENLKTAFGVFVILVVLELLGFGAAAVAARARTVVGR